MDQAGTDRSRPFKHNRGAVGYKGDRLIITFWETPIFIQNTSQDRMIPRISCDKSHVVTFCLYMHRQLHAILRLHVSNSLSPPITLNTVRFGKIFVFTFRMCSGRADYCVYCTQQLHFFSFLLSFLALEHF